MYTKIYLFIIFSIFTTLCIASESSFFQDNVTNNKGLKFLSTNPEDADKDLTFEEIVTRKGYPLSSYSVRTEDGYILKLYRISGGKNSPQSEQNNKNEKKVVFFQHGLLDSSDNWVANYEVKSPVFILANLGYDVWLGNNRGNKHSRNHISINPSDPKFWDFSFHEMGLYDIPAMARFIQNETIPASGEIKKITYVGHSQGTSQFFAGMTLLPEFYEKSFNGFVALGPVAFMEYVSSKLIRDSLFFHLDYIFTKAGFVEMLPNVSAVSTFEKFICVHTPYLCNMALEAFADDNTDDDDKDRFLVFLNHFPSGSSMKCLTHYAQSIKTKTFATFGDMVPYDFTKVKNMKIALFVGGQDELATVKDNRFFKTVLQKNGLLDFYKEYEKMGHLSYFVSIGNEYMVDFVEKVKEYSA